MNEPPPISPDSAAADLLATAPAAGTPPPVPSPVLALPAPSDVGEPGKPKAGDVDAKGTAFDPSKHSGAKHRQTGAWMPRSPGRRRKAAPAVAEDSPRPAEPVRSDLPPAAETAWSAEERAAAEAPGGFPPPEAAAAASEPVDRSTDAAEAVTSALYLVMGAVTGAPDEAVPTAAEHSQLCRSVAAYIRSTGWNGGPLAGMILGLSAWALRTLRKPKSAAAVQKWMEELRRPRAKNVTPPKPAAESPKPAAAAPGPAFDPVPFADDGGFTESAGS